MDEKLKEVQKRAEEEYGDATFGHTNLGLEWTGILQNHYQIRFDHPIPPHIVLLMMAASKINRAAVPFRGQGEDDYIDGISYIDLAKIAEKRKKKS